MAAFLRRRRRLPLWTREALLAPRAGLGAPAAAGAPPVGAATFWRGESELCGFSRGTMRGRAPLRAVTASSYKAGTAAGAAPASGGSAKRVPPRYAVLCDNVEWVVAQGEHNLWEASSSSSCSAKRGGFLVELDLRKEVYTLFKQALAAVDGAAPLAPSDAPSPIVHHGLLSVLHPWSNELEELKLEDVAAALD